jgi:phenylalanyl-tRNA synthetase beta chain
MRIPISWLKDYVDVTVTADRLAQDLTLAGLELGGIERDGQDAVLDLEITTNRVDCMNIRGVAREVATLYGLQLRPLALDFEELGPSAGAALAVRIEAPDLCPRFAARVLDVRVGPAPDWMRARLEAVGVRPISNLVDLSNYVMMEMGHPSHAFDLAKIPGAELRIRWAREGERLVTLDGVERPLGVRCGVVASKDAALAVAGVMGGASSEVSDVTRTVALEAAYWSPLAIRRAAREVGLHTEASHRFERGADPEGPIEALARIAHLLVANGMGSVRPGLIDVYPVPLPPRRVALNHKRARVVLGVDVPRERAHSILTALGFEGDAAGAAAAGEAVYRVPSWRGDVAREADLIEEVGRHFGLERIPATIPAATLVEGLRPAQRRERLVRQLLVAAGLREVINYAFVARRDMQPLTAEAVRLKNPLSEEQDVLRTSLVVPGLLTNLKVNLSHGLRAAQLFELGRVFAPAVPLPTEEKRLAILLAGERRRGHWSEKGRVPDIYDLKGIVSLLGERLGVGLDVRRDETPIPAFLHPGRSAAILMAGVAIGALGALHPDVARSWEFRTEVVVLELALDAILSAPVGAARFKQLPRFPFVERDLSLVCEASLPASEVVGLTRGAAGKLVTEVQVTDRYSGAPIPSGKLNYTLTLRFQESERTLTGEEVQQSLDRVVAALHAAGVELRGA